MKNFLMTLSVVFLAGIFCISVSCAEEAVPLRSNETDPSTSDVTQEADTDFGYGTVAAIADGSIVVNEYDYVEDRDIPVTYLTEAGLDLEHVSSLKEIKAGDMVDVVYTRRDNEKVADSISVAKPKGLPKKI